MKTLAITLGLTLAVSVFSTARVDAAAADDGKPASSYFKQPEKSGLTLNSAGKIAFGPGGMLLLSDPKSASVVAVDTGDKGPVVRLAKRVEDIDSALTKAVGSEKITIIDMAVNPASGKIYFSVNSQPGNQVHILALAADGTVSHVDLSKSPYVRMTLPTEESGQLRNVTDLAWGDHSVIVAGQSAEEFANKIYQIPVPLENGVNAQYCSGGYRPHVYRTCGRAAQ